MRAAVEAAYGQALGLFEPLAGEAELVSAGATRSSAELAAAWRAGVDPVLKRAGLPVPASPSADLGGRTGRHTEHLEGLVRDLQSVYRMVPGGSW
jgi:ring-1,2-phenylacetyl-CoA epoxidase subunit PaaC